jgi:hypothetical protein
MNQQPRRGADGAKENKVGKNIGPNRTTLCVLHIINGLDLTPA